MSCDVEARALLHPFIGFDLPVVVEVRGPVPMSEDLEARVFGPILRDDLTKGDLLFRSAGILGLLRHSVDATNVRHPDVAGVVLGNVGALSIVTKASMPRTVEKDDDVIAWLAEASDVHVFHGSTGDVEAFGGSGAVDGQVGDVNHGPLPSVREPSTQPAHAATSSEPSSVGVVLPGPGVSSRGLFPEVEARLA